jgi:hypothetical protein
VCANKSGTGEGRAQLRHALDKKKMFRRNINFLREKRQYVSSVSVRHWVLERRSQNFMKRMLLVFSPRNASAILCDLKDETFWRSLPRGLPKQIRLY